MQALEAATQRASFYVGDAKPGSRRRPKTRLGKKTEMEFSKVPWGPLAAVLYALGVFVVAQLLAPIVLIIYPHLRGWDTATANAWLDGSIVAQFGYVLCAEVLTFGAVWWFLNGRGASLRAIGWRRPRWTDPLHTLAGLVVYFATYAVILALVTHLFPSLNVNQKQELGFDNPTTSRMALLLTFLSLVVLPPVVEEVLFRGFMFTGLRTKLKPIGAALLTSALFATAHLEFGSGKPLLWVAGIDTFTLSLVLCYLRHKTDSLWPGIFLHALKNFIAFASLYLFVAH